MEIKKGLGRLAGVGLFGLALLVSGCGNGQDREVRNAVYRGYHFNKADGEYSLVFDKAGEDRVFASGDPKKGFSIGKCYDVVLEDSGIFPGLPEIKSYKPCD